MNQAIEIWEGDLSPPGWARAWGTLASVTWKQFAYPLNVGPPNSAGLRLSFGRQHREIPPNGCDVIAAHLFNRILKFVCLNSRSVWWPGWTFVPDPAFSPNWRSRRIQHQRLTAALSYSVSLVFYLSSGLSSPSVVSFSYPAFWPYVLYPLPALWPHILYLVSISWFSLSRTTACT